ncbi:hypothetical protein B7463_g1359, partial [Scytalidium lignicola]
MSHTMSSVDQRTTEFGWTKLGQAAYDGDETSVKSLLLQSTNPLILDNVGLTPLDHAAVQAHAGVFQILAAQLAQSGYIIDQLFESLSTNN